MLKKFLNLFLYTQKYLVNTNIGDIYEYME